MPIDLHLVSWKRPKMTELVIKTIHRNTKRDSFRLVVWDNGSRLDTQLMLADLQDNGYIDELINHVENIGLEGARQELLERTLSEYFVCIDNDCLPPTPNLMGNMYGPDWLERMVDLMEQYEDFAAIAMRTQVMIGTGNIFEEADQAGDDIVEFPHPGGSFRIMRTDAVKSVGGWSRRLDGRGAEERYIGAKLNEAGFRTAFAVNVPCLHLFGLRGANATDRWGYDIYLRPSDTGHSDISHPALTNGDDLEEVAKYVGKELADDYVRN